MSNKVDLTGNKFGNLTVIRESPKKYGRIYWECSCSCGEKVSVSSNHLRSGHTKSCGCLNAACLWNVTHGATRGAKATQEYNMLMHAKKRAKELSLPFDIKLEDIIIPEFCPVFPSVRLGRYNGVENRANSPSLDRVIPNLGYVRGNIAVISYRANSIKQNATAEEILAVAYWVEEETRKGELCRANQQS